MKTITTLLVVGMFLTPVALADDTEDVKLAELDLLAAENAGDMDRMYRHIDPGRTLFLPSGGLLTVAGGEQDKRRRQASFEAGLKFDLQVRHLDAEVYGNTAVLTYYRVGTITRPDGLSRSIKFRVTVIRVKQAGQWKEVHRHGSNLTLP